MKLSSCSKKKYTGISQKDKNISTDYITTNTKDSKQESSELNSLIKQFGEIKILLAKAVTKFDRLNQSKNSFKSCRSSSYTIFHCIQPYKVYQRSLDIYIF